VATKAAAFGVLLRLFDVALIPSAQTWAPAMAVLATVTIIVGNVGALGQSSLKRLLAYSSVAQAGYMLAGVLVTTQLGIAATAFYLAAYLLMNLAAFAVIAVRERETGLGDDISSMNGLARSRRVLAWTMTVAMLALAGIPGTVGFFGKIYLIQASVDNGYGWVGVVIVLGSALSLAYYLRVLVAIWGRSSDEREIGARRMTPGGQPVMAGGAPNIQEADADDDAGGGPAGGRPLERTSARSRGTVAAAADASEQQPPRGHPLAVAAGVLCAAAVVFFGIYPQPLFDVAQDTGSAIASLL
jgi:NADH-quinone oxidoreductase subunit N